MARLVERAEHQPAKCLVTGSWAEPEHPLVDFEAWASCIDPRVYLSPGLVHDVASELLRMVDRDEFEQVQARVQELEERNAELEAENAEANRQLDAIDVLESRGYRERRKPGRPKKVAA